LGISRSGLAPQILVGFFFQGALKEMLTLKKRGGVILGSSKLEGPRGKNPTSLYGKSVPGHKQPLKFISEMM
jgi:hypothetical protein